MIFKVSWFLTKFKEGGSHTLEFPTLHPPQSQPLFLIIQVQVRVATENLHIFSKLFLLCFFTVGAPTGAPFTEGLLQGHGSEDRATLCEGQFQSSRRRLSAQGHCAAVL